MSGGSCNINGQVFPNRSLNPADSTQCCNARTSPNAWLPLFTLSALVPGGGNDEVSADFDSDGRDDVAIADGNGNVEVYFSESDGGWTQPVILPTGLGSSPLRPAAGDLNCDGLQDIVVGSGTQTGSNWIGVLLNLGDHQFASVALYASPSQCRLDPVRIGDFDGDGWPDVIVGLARPMITCPDGQVGLYRNSADGSGSLGAPHVLADLWIAAGSGDVRLGDFDGDGALGTSPSQTIPRPSAFFSMPAPAAMATPFSTGHSLSRCSSPMTSSRRVFLPRGGWRRGFLGKCADCQLPQLSPDLGGTFRSALTLRPSQRRSALRLDSQWRWIARRALRGWLPHRSADQSGRWLVSIGVAFDHGARRERSNDDGRRSQRRRRARSGGDVARSTNGYWGAWLNSCP